MKSLFFTVLSIGLIIWSVTAKSTEFQPWSENVFAYIEQTYGGEAVKRIRYLHGLVEKHQDAPAQEKLRLVNDTLNKLPWIADEKHWKSADYWATPLETIATFGGDCEDIAIAKWVMLRYLGIPSKQLRLAYAKIKKTGENHMVLVYLSNPDAPIGQQGGLVLDNYTEEIKHAAERKDLLAVYTTDADGTIALFSDDGNNRSLKGIYENRKMRKLDDLKKKIAENMKKGQELNDGRPLLPVEAQ